MGRSPNSTKPLRTTPNRAASPTNAAWSTKHTGAGGRPGLGHAGTAPRSPPRPSIYAPGLVRRPARLDGTPHASATSSPRTRSQPASQSSRSRRAPIESNQQAAFTPPASRPTVLLIGRSVSDPPSHPPRSIGGSPAPCWTCWTSQPAKPVPASCAALGFNSMPPRPCIQWPWRG